MDPIVSVLLPVYNAQKYIKDAIDSILKQTYEDFELIIINDGSIDESEQIILSFDDKRINYIKNEKNIGIVASLNKGIALSKGSYIARMDADDISQIERFEKQVAYLDNNPDIGLCGSQLKVLGEKRILEYPILNEDIKFYFLSYNSIAHPVVMFRKKVLLDNQLTYESEDFPAEDYKLWIRLGEFCKFYNFEEPLLNYRLHESSVSHSQRDNQRNKTSQIRAHYLLKSCGIWEKESEDFMKSIFLDHSISFKYELDRLENLLNKCFESNTTFDKNKFKNYLNDIFYHACRHSKVSIFFVLFLYAKSKFFGGYKRLVKLSLVELKRSI